MTTYAGNAEQTLALFRADSCSEDYKACSISNGPIDEQSWNAIESVILEVCPGNAEAIQHELMSLQHGEKDDLHARLFTAWSSNAVVGTTLMATTFASNEILQMTWVLVRPRYRAQGIGKALIDAAFAFADKVGLGVYGVTDRPDIFTAYASITAVPFTENRWLCVREKQVPSVV